MSESSERRRTTKRFADINSLSLDQSAMILRLIYECHNPGLKRQASKVFNLWFNMQIKKQIKN